MERPEAVNLLHAWERGATQGPTIRGLLLLGAALPAAAPAELADYRIGRRDSLLLEMRERLFGPDLECVASCAHCGERIELAFPIDGVRAVHGGAEVFEAETDGYRARFRLPSSADLLAIEAQPDASAAESLLMRRCLIAVTSHDDSNLAPVDPPPGLVEAIDARMAELDSQAQILLDITCAVCARAARATFDIVSHLWSELDGWARGLMRDIHAIAGAYGWSEPQILALSPARRRVYLEFIEGVP